MEITWETARWIITAIIIPTVFAIRSRDRKEMEQISAKTSAVSKELSDYKVEVAENYTPLDRFVRTEDRTDETLASLTATINENHRQLVNLINSKV